MQMDSILIVDDEPILRKLLSRMLELEGYEIWQAESCQSANKILSQRSVKVVLCDVFLPDGNGVTFVSNIKALYPNTEVILLTAHGNIPDGVQAIKNGAFDYITKGDDNNKIIPLISRAMSQAKCNLGVKSKIAEKVKDYSFDTIVANSDSMKKIVTLAKKVSITDTTVLITGETGTGKEVLARAIHNESNRRNKDFLAINCSAFSKDLLESELFGHKAGSFTGALKEKKGLFEVANGGTIFLDEIGEISFELQAKLLRVLENGDYIKIGDTKSTHVDVRIISATNRDLKKEIEKNNFREDLYYRLSVFNLNIPSLRERRSDIPELMDYFIVHYSNKLNKKINRINDDYKNLVYNAPWRGNIRELKNVIECSLIVSDDTLSSKDLPLEILNSESANATNQSDINFELTTVERQHILKVLQYTNGNKTEAARLLKIGLTTLYRKIEEYAINI